MNKIVWASTSERSLLVITTRGEIWNRPHGTGQWSQLEMPPGVEVDDAPELSTTPMNNEAAKKRA